MANIRESVKKGKAVSYRFIACLGRDKQGKPIRKYTTWPPQGHEQTKAAKEAEKQAELWKKNLKEDALRTIDEPETIDACLP